MRKKQREGEIEGEGRSLTEEDTTELLSRMEDDAEVSTEKELTPETWNETFDASNSIETPIGRVKMGANQISKFFDKKRTKEFGMVGPTLRNPDIIIEEKSEAKDGNSERESSYLFIKTFSRNGEKIKFYASITVRQEDMEISVSSHYMNRKAIQKKMTAGKVLYIRKALLLNSSEWHLAEHHDGVPDLLPTQGNNAGGKVTANASKKQGKGKKKVTVEYDLESNTWKGIPKEANLVSTGKAERGIVEGFTNDPRIRAMHDTRTGKTWLRVDAEREYKNALDYEGDVEQKWEVKIQDYVAEHYPTQATVSAETKSAKGLEEREAMKSDSVLRAMREKADAENKKAADATFAAWKKMEASKEKMEAREHKADVVENPSHGEEVLRDAVIDKLRESGIEVLGAAEGQKVLDMANGKDVRLEAKRKRALETASVSRDEKHQPTVVSSADGAKILNNLDTLANDFEKLSNTPKSFIGNAAKALGAERFGSGSEYATFETKNGKVVTIRLSNHNAKVAVLEDMVEKLEQERAAAMSQAVDEEQQHKVQEALDWFAAKMSVFSKEEQEAINACAIAFAERDQIVIPKVSIAVNAKCSQADLMTYASSAFFKIGKKRKSIAQFLSIVFEAYFPGGEGFVYKKMPGAKECSK